tara:strand:+ start:264 stop:599 length:336 start_codon:yes stop_codon:yes gene_type:complete
MTRTEKALLEALPHVYRQQRHGKHEQDRADAVAWLAEYGELVRDLKTRPSMRTGGPFIWCADQPPSPTITSGAGAPAGGEPVNSLYLQTDSCEVWVMLEDGWAGPLVRSNR